MLKETMYWIQLGILSAFLGGMMGSPTKALAGLMTGKMSIMTKVPVCECNEGDNCMCP